MRRKDREITDPAEIDAMVLVCRLRLLDDRQPNVIPVSFGYENKSIYIHSAPEGKKNHPA